MWNMTCLQQNVSNKARGEAAEAGRDGVDRSVSSLYIYVPGGIYSRIVLIALCDCFDLLKRHQL